MPVGVYIGAPAGQTMGLYTLGQERLRITDIGWVGIGTLNPSTQLHVIGGPSEAIYGESETSIGV